MWGGHEAGVSGLEPFSAAVGVRRQLLAGPGETVGANSQRSAPFSPMGVTHAMLLNVSECLVSHSIPMVLPFSPLSMWETEIPV